MAFAGDDELAALANVHPALRDSMQFPQPPSAADLPDRVLDILLSLVDAPTFASLAVLNRHWRTKCSTVSLYAHHLALATSPKKLQEYITNDLVTLKRRFALVARQSLFPVYRPRLSTYHIVAPAVLSPSSSPHGEFFSYSFSSRASHLAVYSACRLFVMDMKHAEPVVKRALSLTQRPLAVDVSDDGSKLAMLVSELKLKVFSLLSDQALQSHSFIMDEPAKAICLTPDGTMVAVAQEDCIELFALVEIPGRVPRRAIACEGVSHVAFSQNGKLLLGSHTRSAKASTTVISAPEDMTAGMGDEDDEDAAKEDMAVTWISRPLFPTAFEKTTHAALLPGDDLTLLAYDEPADSFGILDANLMSFTTSLLAVPSEFLQPSSLPCVTAGGDVAAIPFSRSGIRILSLSDLAPSDQHDSPAKQRWIPFTKPISRARWQLDSGRQECLLASGAGKSSHPHVMRTADEEQRETGSIFAFEFDYHVDATRLEDVVINLDTVDVEALRIAEDGEDAAISIQKRPASRASDRPRNAPLARSVTAARRKQRATVPAVPEVTAPQDVAAPVGTDAAEAPEEQLLDEVYHPSQPRPQSTLIRSASTIAARREREPPRFLANAQPRLRRAGDPSEVPDESDADNWVPPPPAYDGVLEDNNRRRSDVRGSRLPPVPPERSPNRPKLALNTSTSTPDLHASSSRGRAEPAEARPGADAKKPNKLQRPKQKRVKSAVENARKSLVMSSQSVRRAFSGPANEDEGKPLPERPIPRSERPMPPPSGAQSSVRSTRPRPPQPEPVRKPVAARAAAPLPPVERAESSRSPRPRPVSLAAEPELVPKRRSVLQRPLSLASSGILESRPANRRSLSQPLPRTFSPHSIPHLGSPDNPALPEAAQMNSLHRRQTSGSVSSVGSNLSGMAPKAAMGAVRAGTNPNSPWASSTMLATLSEGATAEDVDGAPTSGRPLSGQYSPRTTGTPPRRLQEARRSLNASGLAMHQRTASYSSTDSPSRPSTSPQQSDRPTPDGQAVREKRPETSGSGRLTTIQSIASTIKERSRSRGSPSARAAGVQRSNSKRDKQVGVTSSSIADAKKRGKGFFAKWKKTLFSSLESV